MKLEAELALSQKRSEQIKKSGANRAAKLEADPALQQQRAAAKHEQYLRRKEQQRQQE